MEKDFLSVSEISGLEQLEIKGGANLTGDGILTQGSCTNNAEDCGDLEQGKCVNTADMCGGSSNQSACVNKATGCGRPRPEKPSNSPCAG